MSVKELSELLEISCKNKTSNQQCNSDCWNCIAKAIHDAGYRKGPFKVIIENPCDYCGFNNNCNHTEFPCIHKDGKCEKRKIFEAQQAQAEADGR